MASQEVIKELGTNGGGFFNANSGHPFENPTPFSNFIEIELIFLIPAALTITLGKMTGSSGHGWAVFAAMAILFVAGFAVCYWAEVATSSAAAWRGPEDHAGELRRQYGRQGSTFRHLAVGALRDRHHRYQLRRSQFLA